GDGQFGPAEQLGAGPGVDTAELDEPGAVGLDSPRLDLELTVGGEELAGCEALSGAIGGRLHANLAADPVGAADDADLELGALVLVHNVVILSDPATFGSQS